jgi:alpha-tubulin suppressor-like RCC1 family protein
MDTCGVTAAGVVKCWGAGANDARGKGPPSNSLVPVDLTNHSTGLVAVSAGVSTCVITSTGAVKCWGGEHNSLLGPTPGSRAPVDVPNLSSGVVSVSVGTEVACAIRSIGAVRCWGAGDLGNNRSYSPVAVDVVGLSSGVTSVSAGFQHVCAVTAIGAVKCWGRNEIGQLGDGSTDSRGVPVDVAGLASGVVSVSAGYGHSCVVTSAGAVKCWGANYYGQLGNNSTDFSMVPVDVIGLSSGVVSVSTGGYYTCAVTSAGSVKCWGSHRWGVFGDPTTTSTSLVPEDVVGLSSNVIAVSVGQSHTCAITTTGAVQCWGTNQFGELGNGTTIGSSVPVDVLGF